MEQKNLSTINLSRKQLKDVEEFCKLNKIENVEEFLQKCFIDGYEIEKYGLLQNSGGSREKWVEKEVIVEKRVEVPVEVIIEKPIIEYVEVEKEVIKEVIVEKVVEKPIEIIKEIPVEKIVIKEVIKEIPVEKVVTHTEYITDETKVRELLDELERLRNIPPTIVEKEIIKEVPVEVVVEVEKIVEVVKEIPTVVEKTTVDLSKQKALEETIQKLRGELQLKNKEIESLNNTIREIQTSGGVRGVMLDGSNLNRTINRI
jgi:hypothetical protein